MISYRLTVPHDDPAQPPAQVTLSLKASHPDGRSSLYYSGPDWACDKADLSVAVQMGLYRLIGSDCTPLDLAAAMAAEEMRALHPVLVDGQEILTMPSHVGRGPRPGPILRYRLTLPPAGGRLSSPSAREASAGERSVEVWLQVEPGQLDGPIRYQGPLEDVRVIAGALVSARGMWGVSLGDETEPSHLRHAMNSEWLSCFKPVLLEDTFPK